MIDTPLRCAVVTGAATGIGRATAVALARDGHAVALVGRRAKPLEELEKLGPGYEAAAELFAEVALTDEFAEFLTLPAYERLA